ncbi:MAG: HNH endonuclease [Chitinophagaceae bacterium]
MITNLAGEKWKVVSFDFKFTNDYQLEVSNMGRLKAYNKFSDGDILQGSTINGYRIIRLKLYKPKDKKTKDTLTAKHDQILALQKKINAKKYLVQQAKKKTDPAIKKLKTEIAEGAATVKEMRSVLRKARQQDIKNRTMHYHSLIHRLVAEHFCKAKSPKHTVVGHVDYDKMNNKAANLKWMTPEENYKHQQSSPFVIAEKRDRVTIYKDSPRGAKLTVDKVKELKKLLKEGKKVKSLVKKFKITDTQILRIKRGENWAGVDAAK